MSKPSPLVGAFHDIFDTWFTFRQLPRLMRDIEQRGHSEIQQCHVPGMVGNLEHYILQLQYDGTVSKETADGMLARTRNPVCFGRALALSLPDDLMLSRKVRWIKGSKPGEKQLQRNYLITRKGEN